VLMWVVFFGLSLLYINIMRERVAFSDGQKYVQAAFNLHQGEPLDREYLYPPLWVWFLASFIPIHTKLPILIVAVVNLASLVAFIPLLMATLKRFGWSIDAAALSVFGILLVNVPVLRNIGYLQINLLVADCVLGSLLLYRKHKGLSA